MTNDTHNLTPTERGARWELSGLTDPYPHLPAPGIAITPWTDDADLAEAVAGLSDVYRELTRRCSWGSCGISAGTCGRQCVGRGCAYEGSSCGHERFKYWRGIVGGEAFSGTDNSAAAQRVP